MQFLLSAACHNIRSERRLGDGLFGPVLDKCRDMLGQNQLSALRQAVTDAQRQRLVESLYRKEVHTMLPDIIDAASSIDFSSVVFQSRTWAQAGKQVRGCSMKLRSGKPQVTLWTHSPYSEARNGFQRTCSLHAEKLRIASSVRHPLLLRGPGLRNRNLRWNGTDVLDILTCNLASTGYRR